MIKKIPRHSYKDNSAKRSKPDNLMTDRKAKQNQEREKLLANQEHTQSAKNRETRIVSIRRIIISRGKKGKEKRKKGVVYLRFANVDTIAHHLDVCYRGLHRTHPSSLSEKKIIVFERESCEKREGSHCILCTIVYLALVFLSFLLGVNFCRMLRGFDDLLRDTQGGQGEGAR